MKAIEVSRYGGPEVLQVVDLPTPTPGPGQIVIQTKAAGINFTDLMSRAGTYPSAPKPPFVPGMEAAGVVAAVGEGVTNHKAVAGSPPWRRRVTPNMSWPKRRWPRPCRMC